MNALLLLLACTGPPKKVEGLYGTRPDAPLPAPTFTATASDGTPRTKDDLLGHPTVMWFYPAAATYG